MVPSAVTAEQPLPVWWEAALDAAEAAGPPEVVVALTHEREPRRQTLASPHLFLCEDGRRYWVKTRAQGGLFAELVAGRLGCLTGFAPGAQVVEVVKEALPIHHSDVHPLGIYVGIEDIPGALNTRDDLQEAIGAKTFAPAALDGRSWTAASLFRLWVAAGDAQALVAPNTGQVWSHDHGDAFGPAFFTPLPATLPYIPIAPVQPPTLNEHLPAVLAAILSVTDDQIVKAVARMPATGEWQAPRERRLAVAQGLSQRRKDIARLARRWAQ